MTVRERIERPILFSGPMVRAILEGRKTQTRRAVRAPTEDLNHPAVHHWQTDQEHRAVAVAHSEKVADQYITTFPHYRIRCPYGIPGDRLWVREIGWERPIRTARDLREGADTWEKYYYDADGLSDGDHEQFKSWGFKRRPSIHMPRWASRITLEVTGVRVERLQEIGDTDALAEGIYPTKTGLYPGSPREAFRELWDSINAKRAPWASNPWVWVVEFKLLKGATP